MRHIFAFCLLLLAQPLVAKDLKPFAAEDMKRLEAHYQGQKFLVAVWSITCPPCMDELRLLGKWREKYEDVPLVLIAADLPTDQQAVAAVLKEYGLEDADTWIFADTNQEKPRFSIDRQWHGEMPRSYFYRTDGEREALSGPLTERHLRLWFTKVQ